MRSRRSPTRSRKPDPDAKGEGFTEAFKILNGLAMFDMLSTLTGAQAIRRVRVAPGPTGGSRRAWNVKRLQPAFLAVRRPRESIDPEKFVFQYGQRMMAFPLDQRRDIIEYLDPKSFDSLKAEEDGDKLITADQEHMPSTPRLIPTPRSSPTRSWPRGRKKLTKFVYYMEKLKLLFDTPRKDPTATAAESTDLDRVTPSKAETKRVTGGTAKANTGAEEGEEGGCQRSQVDAEPGKFGGPTFNVDPDSDPNDIVVQATVFLQTKAESTGDRQGRQRRSRRWRTASRRRLRTQGLHRRRRVRELAVHGRLHGRRRPEGQMGGRRPTGLAARPKGFAHELHHLMAFELDRYDYIEAHAANEDMDIPDRLHWFRQELDQARGLQRPLVDHERRRAPERRRRLPRGGSGPRLLRCRTAP